MKKSETNLKRVEQAMDAMKRAVMVARDRLGEGLQLTRTQFDILMILDANAQTTTELAARLLLTQSAITQTIDTLVRRDLVQRVHDDTDRRIIHLALSPDGRALTDHVRQLRRKTLAALLNSLSGPEVEALIAITDKLTEIFSAGEATQNVRG